MTGVGTSHSLPRELRCDLGDVLPLVPRDGQLVFGGLALAMVTRNGGGAIGRSAGDLREREQFLGRIRAAFGN